MTFGHAAPPSDFKTLPVLPRWITARRAQTPEDVAFMSGAALSHLHLVVSNAAVPQTLLRERLALAAAEAQMRLLGRPEREPDLRDAVHLLRPGDHPGPAGEVYLAWRRSVERPISVKALARALPHITPEQIASWLDGDPSDGSDPCHGSGPRGAEHGGPVARAAMVLDAVLTDLPRGEHVALTLADAALAQAVGWKYLVPVLSTFLKPRDLREDGDDLRLACHRAVVAAVPPAVQLAADLSRRVAQLEAVVPKLRAKGAAKAVAMILARDAVTPMMLAAPSSGTGLSGRAARRLCDRLVDLGVVRELTGRDAFRLYGV